MSFGNTIVRHSKFGEVIHFGVTGEILKLMIGGVEEYHDLGWNAKVGNSIKQSGCAGYNSVLSSRASIGEHCYLEVSFVHSKAKIGSNVVLSYIDIHDETIPDNVVIHGLKQRNGKFVARIYGIHDNPKENKLFGKDLDEIIAWNKRMRELVQMDEIMKAIRYQIPAKQMHKLPQLTKIQKEWLAKRLERYATIL